MTTGSRLPTRGGGSAAVSANKRAGSKDLGTLASAPSAKAHCVVDAPVQNVHVRPDHFVVDFDLRAQAHERRKHG
jgi:hypothetical protein